MQVQSVYLVGRKQEEITTLLDKTCCKILIHTCQRCLFRTIVLEADNLYEETRAKLLPTNAEKLVFLHHNLPILNLNYDEDN